MRSVAPTSPSPTQPQPGSSFRAEALARIARAARRTEWRVRADAALRTGTRQSLFALAVLGATLAVVKTVPRVPPSVGRVALVGAALWILISAIVAGARRIAPLRGAMLLDRHHGLAGRLANALSFARAPERSAFMDLAIADACAHVEELSPRRAYPLRAPRDLLAAAGVAALVGTIAALEVRTRKAVPTAKPLEPALLDAEDLELFREVGQHMGDPSRDPELLAAVAEYNQLVDDLAHQRLDRTEAFRRLERLQARLVRGAGLDAQALEQELRLRAQALEKSELTRPAAEALKAQDLPKVERELRELAKRIQSKPDALAKRDLDRLRDALKRASEGASERTATLEQRRAELQEQQLLRRKENADAGAESDEERRLLNRRDRELERLDREIEDQQRANRQLDRLDRDLAKAAEDLMRDLGLSAKDLEQGAEDINRMAEENMSEKDREELLKRLEDLREQLRQGGQGGSQRLAQLRRFARMVRGGGSRGGGQRGERGEGQGNESQEQEGQNGQGQGEQQGGQGQAEGETWTIGPGGEKTLVMRQGRRSGNSSQGQGQGQSEGQGQGQPGQASRGQGQGPEQGSGQQGSGSNGDPSGGNGQDRGGRDWGTGHDPNLTGEKATDPKMGTMDVQAAGLDTGRGATRSEVIYGAGEKGFRGGAYKRVYTEYRTSQEEHIGKDRVPPGANERIRRYFDLIRPRD